MFDELVIWLFQLLRFFFQDETIICTTAQHDPLGGGVNSALVGNKRGNATPQCRARMYCCASVG